MVEMIIEEIKKFKEQYQEQRKQISKIEIKRNQLAEQRNSAKKNAVTESDWQNINDLGKEISNLGNQSQELQKQVDREILESKKQIISKIDNLIAEEIRKARLINEQIQEIEDDNKVHQERKVRYEIQKQEFYKRFGREPEFSEETREEISKLTEKFKESQKEIIKLENRVNEIESGIQQMANIKEDFKRGNIQKILEEAQTEQKTFVEEAKEEIPQIEEIQIEEAPVIENIEIEEPPVIENIEIEEPPVIENINIEEPPELEELNIEDLYVDEFKEFSEEKDTDPIEEDLIKQIEKLLEEKELEEKEIITIEDEVQNYNDELKNREQPALIECVIVKAEKGKLVYKAQINNEDTIVYYPEEKESLVKEIIDKTKKAFIEYAIEQHEMFDKNVMNYIDYNICKLFYDFAKKYNNDFGKLVYNYAMTFSEEDIEVNDLPDITYNIAEIKKAKLKGKQKHYINKICKSASLNSEITIIDKLKGISRLKYAIKKLFGINNVQLLPEGKH